MLHISLNSLAGYSLFNNMILKYTHVVYACVLILFFLLLLFFSIGRLKMLTFYFYVEEWKCVDIECQLNSVNCWLVVVFLPINLLILFCFISHMDTKLKVVWNLAQMLVPRICHQLRRSMTWMNLYCFLQINKVQ